MTGIPEVEEGPNTHSAGFKTLNLLLSFRHRTHSSESSLRKHVSGTKADFPKSCECAHFQTPPPGLHAAPRWLRCYS